MSRSLSFSKRTVAIALAASVVASGVQVVAPSFESPFGAAVAQAQQAGHVQNEDVTFKGIFSGENLIEGTLKSGSGANAGDPGTVLPGDAKAVFTINVGNAAVGDTITITPRTTYTDTKTGEQKTVTYRGLTIATSEAKSPLKIGDVQVASVETKAAGSATITFEEGVDKFADGEITVSIPVDFKALYREDITIDKNVYSGVPATWVARIKASGSEQPTDTDPRDIHFVIVDEVSIKPFLNAWAPSHGVKINGDKFNIEHVEQRAPYSQDFEAELCPATDANYARWTFSDSIEPKLLLITFDEEGKRSGQLTKKDEVDATGVTMTSERTANGCFKVKVDNLTGKDYKPMIAFVGDVGSGDYEPGKQLAMDATFTKPGGTPIDNSASSKRFATLGGTSDGDGTGNQKNPQAEVTGTAVDGQEAGAGVDSPARIAGKDTTFNFTVKNTGNVAITEVEVTDPSGKKTPVKLDTPLAPGAETVVSANYKVPSDAEKLEFSLKATPGALDLGTFPFLVDQSLKYKDNGDGTVTLIDPTGKETVVVTKEEYDKLVKRVEELEGKQDVYVIDGVRNDDNSITLTLNNGQTITIPAAKKAGLEKCLNAPGGALLALLPVLGLLTAGLSQLNVDAINKSIIDWQKGAGIYNEEAAKFVAQNRGPLGALLGALIGSIILFVPGLCGDVSLAGALKESFGKGSSAPAVPAPKPEEKPAPNTDDQDAA